MLKKILTTIFLFIGFVTASTASGKDVIYHRELSSLRDENQFLKLVEISYPAFKGVLSDSEKKTIRGDVRAFVKEEKEKWKIYYGIEDRNFSYYGKERRVIFETYYEVHVNKQALIVTLTEGPIKAFRWVEKPLSVDKWAKAIGAAAPHISILDTFIKYTEVVTVSFYELTLHTDVLLISFFYRNDGGLLEQPSQIVFVADAPCSVLLDRQNLKFIGYEPGVYGHLKTSSLSKRERKRLGAMHEMECPDHAD